MEFLYGLILHNSNTPVRFEYFKIIKLAINLGEQFYYLDFVQKYELNRLGECTCIVRERQFFKITQLTPLMVTHDHS